MWIDVHPNRNHGPYFESTLNWLWYSSKYVYTYTSWTYVYAYLYILYLYIHMWNSKDLSAVKSINRMTWMFKNNFKRRNVIAFNFFSFSRKETNGQTGEQQTRRADKSVLELKTAWYFCYSKKKGGEGLKEQKQKLLRVKRCLRVPSTFSWYFVSWWKILCCSSRRQRWLVRFRHQPSETPAHSPSRACHRILNHSHTQCHPPSSLRHLFTRHTSSISHG